MITIKDVSDLARVSQATVSRVVNGTASVSRDKRQRVEQAMATLGYQPNAIAQALASSRSGSIGLVLPTLDGPFFGDLMFNIEAQIRKRGMCLVVAAGGVDPESQMQAVDFLLSRRVDALILYTPRITDEKIEEINKQGVNLVVLNRYVPSLASSCIYVDNHSGSKQLVESLLHQGHQRIACITGPLSECDARERLDGYQHALQDAGFDYDESMVFEGDYQDLSGREGMAALLANSSFSAVFCCNDLMACGAYYVLREQGLRIPEDMSVVGFDNINYCQYLLPQLTSVNVPVKKMGEIAIDMVMAKIKGLTLEVENKLLTEMIVRDSVIELID